MALAARCLVTREPSELREILHGALQAQDQQRHGAALNGQNGTMCRVSTVFCVTRWVPLLMVLRRRGVHRTGLAHAAEIDAVGNHEIFEDGPKEAVGNGDGRETCKHSWQHKDISVDAHQLQDNNHRCQGEAETTGKEPDHTKDEARLQHLLRQGGVAQHPGDICSEASNSATDETSNDEDGFKNVARCSHSHRQHHREHLPSGEDQKHGCGRCCVECALQRLGADAPDPAHASVPEDQRADDGSNEGLEWQCHPNGEKATPSHEPQVQFVDAEIDAEANEGAQPSDGHTNEHPHVLPKDLVHGAAFDTLLNLPAPVHLQQVMIAVQNPYHGCRSGGCHQDDANDVLRDTG